MIPKQEQLSLQTRTGHSIHSSQSGNTSGKLYLNTDIGVESCARLPYVRKNYPTTISRGKLLCDSLCNWVSKKLVLGPYDPDSLSFTNPRMLLAPKLNGAGHIVVDMSAPHLPADRINIHRTSPITLNTGIDPKKFPSTRVSTLHVLKQFHTLGPNCFFSKQDWLDAFKHIMV